MYTNYNISQPRTYYPQIFYKNNLRPNNDERFLGGGFLGPFLLGGVGGYLLGKPNYNGPIPVFFPNVPYQPYPYLQTNYYY